MVDERLRAALEAYEQARSERPVARGDQPIRLHATTAAFLQLREQVIEPIMTVVEQALLRYGHAVEIVEQAARIDHAGHRHPPSVSLYFMPAGGGYRGPRYEVRPYIRFTPDPDTETTRVHTWIPDAGGEGRGSERSYPSALLTPDIVERALTAFILDVLEANP